MAHQITVEEAAGHLPELVRQVRGGQEIVFTEGRRPVARLVSVEEDTPSGFEMAQLAMVGGAFDWLADEPDLYTDEPADRVPALLHQWQQKYGLPPRPDGQAHTSVQELFAQWNREDAHLTPEEADAERRLWEDREKNHPQVLI